MNYYTLTFTDDKSYSVASEVNMKDFIKHIRRHVTEYYFGTTAYLNHPVRVQQVAQADKVYEKWSNF